MNKSMAQKKIVLKSLLLWEFALFIYKQNVFPALVPAYDYHYKHDGTRGNWTDSPSRGGMTMTLAYLVMCTTPGNTSEVGWGWGTGVGSWLLSLSMVPTAPHSWLRPGLWGWDPTPYSAGYRWQVMAWLQPHYPEFGVVYRSFCSEAHGGQMEPQQQVSAPSEQ